MRRESDPMSLEPMSGRSFTAMSIFFTHDTVRLSFRVVTKFYFTLNV
jgi:hypothetical protein